MKSGRKGEREKNEETHGRMKIESRLAINCKDWQKQRRGE